jgi:Tfp pilus assembly protein PilO
MKRQRIIVLAAAAGLAALLGYLSWAFLFQPLKAQVSSEKEALEQDKATLEEAKQKKMQYDKFLAEAENVRRGLDFVTSRLDPKMDYDESQRTFMRIGQGAKIFHGQIKTEKPAVSKDYPGFNESRATISMDCDYHALGEFLNAVNSQRRMMVLTDMHLSGKDPMGHDATVHSELVVKSYSAADGGKP